MFLNQEDLRSFTGYKRPANQRRWLNKHDYQYEVRVNQQAAW